MPILAAALPCCLAALLAVVSPAPPQELAAPLSPRPAANNLWLESGLSLGVDVLNDLPDVIVDVRGLRAGIVNRNRAAFELVWLPRVAYSFDFGLTLGLYGGVGFTGPSTPQLAIMLDAQGLRVARNRDKETGYAFEVMGGPFVGVRAKLPRGGYLLPTLGVHWRGRHSDGLHSKLMVDMRFDTGFRLRNNTFAAIGPSVRMAAFSWGGLSGSAVRDISFSLILSINQAIL